MTATESRNAAKVAATAEIEKFIITIEVAAKSGKTKVWIDDPSDGALAYLKDEGYEIVNFGGTSWLIRW